jgi:ISXO2-like transposase domain
MGTGDEGLHLGMRRLRQADLGNRRHGDAGSKVPLIAWFWAGYLMATHSNGISALQVQKQLGLGSYKTAWLLCAKLRRAMVAPDRTPLNGLVEIDETEIPQRSKDDPPVGGLGRSGQGKMLVAGAVEVHGHRPGRARLAPIADFSATTLHAFINANIAAGATAKTDGWSAYPGAPGVTHHPHVVGPMAAHVVLPWTHRLFANLKRWALGVTTACAASTCNPTSTSSCFASIAATPAMRPSARCSASASLPNTSPTTC